MTITATRRRPGAAGPAWPGKRAEVERRIGAARIVPVLRLADGDAAVAAADGLLRGSARRRRAHGDDEWREALEDRSRHSDRVLGVGTVLDPGAARTAIDLGADFIVSPCPVAGRPRGGGRRHFVEGGMTVAELVDAGSRGLAKLFPAHVGGAQFLRSVLAVPADAADHPNGRYPAGRHRRVACGRCVRGRRRVRSLPRADPAAAIAAALGGRDR